MVTKGLYVRLEAKPGKEKEVEKFLQDSLPIVNAEPATLVWYAIRMGPSTFGIFDAFPDEAGRQEHLSGRVAAALSARASELFAKPPEIHKLDVLAAKAKQAAKVSAEGHRDSQGERIPMQVGSELHITSSGELIMDNPELELAPMAEAADATLAYRFDPNRREHVLRLVDPVAIHT
ncbi:MAG TPA: hypothetical protein VG273_12710 [Bryobacteraceae bacterium]|jgi:quinol monooxygenase YgiN|nr:hypothetical protein [Bryobacteraceae bacterium]